MGRVALRDIRAGLAASEGRGGEVVGRRLGCVRMDAGEVVCGCCCDALTEGVLAGRWWLLACDTLWDCWGCCWR